MKFLEKQFFHNFLFLLLCYCGFFILFFSFLILKYQASILNEDAFLNWDAHHYFVIAVNGYDKTSTAFFPLFPIIWKLSGLSSMGISVFNFFVFIFSFSFLATNFNFNKKEILLLSFIPSFIFMYLPYTESLFFASGVILLISLKEKKHLLVCLAIFLCCIVRPVSFVFIPACLITTFFSSKSFKNFLITSSCYCLSCICGLLFSFSCHYYYTDDFFNFFHSQESWGNHLQMPTFHLTSWAGTKIVMLDASALFFGFTCIVLLIHFFIKVLRQKKVNAQSEIIFSASYVGGISLLILFYRGGSLFSLNRFVYASVFSTVILYHFIKTLNWDFKKIGMFVFVSLCFWLMFGSYGHIETFLKFFALSIFLSLFLLINHPKKVFSETAFFVCLTCNIILEGYLLYRFFTWEWVA